MVLKTYISSLYYAGCRVKIHKEHYGEEGLAPCKVHYDPNTAKELLLLATTEEEQKLWVSRLSKRIQKGGYKAVSQSRSVLSYVKQPF